MVTVIGGKATGSFKPADTIAGKPRPRKPVSSVPSSSGDSAKTQETKKSALWLPGDDDDLL